ncbi:hypothetical protein IU433_12870 [Nocardia puris]|uniref:Uncharacterized protein n=1 Tax=Nocardia puris TaxID=208602 RepID=A0A366DQT3_9NOCA|nr:hypothetical protein [Nocardia puris]MBF6213606.1 hypothetical protein [Nocardia puris]MBF6365464.1 hypothetical protein [Nocardia puris]MBF6459930.1 hypothetical protein [Nocardia puris]RBO91588.1 hypothetical protein DFR74_104292 [Nocardia puris]
MDRGLKNAPPRYRKLRPGDWVEWLIVGLLFAVSSVGVFVLTGSLLSALFVGVLVWLVAVGVVAML